jgi:acyl-coenzyme A synthetase/AMP-(fatty) acid ligase
MSLKSLLCERGNLQEPALIFEDATFSRGELLGRVDDLAARLRNAGVAPGSRVLLALPNLPAFVISLLAVNDCGAVVMPVNPALSEDERRRLASLARPHTILTADGDTGALDGVRVSRTAEAEDADAEGAAAIIFTSGTTGGQKGVMLSETSLMANARAVAAYLRLAEHDRTLIFLPLSYAYALSQLLSTFSAGGCVVLLPNLRYPVIAFRTMAEHRITGFGGVPTSLAILARARHAAGTPFDSLRYILSAGGPLSSTLAESVRQAFPGVELFNNYGCTEIGPRATTVSYAAHPDKIGSIGRAIPDVRVTIVRADLSIAGVGETGEIVLDGPSLMTGYYRDPETTATRMSRYGFHTGDYAYADADGFIYHQGREDDIFKSAGEKVSATEVEEVVLAHEGVVEAAVVSCPDAILGAVPVVYAVRRPGMSVTDRELQMFCARRLAKHKVPRAVHFVDELQKTASGKIQKRFLRELLQ